MRVFKVTACLLILLAITTVPALAQADPVVTNVKEDLDLQEWIECLNDGEGEAVQLTGTLHVMFITNLDGDGGFHLKYHFQPQGVVGVGLATGTVYHGTGVSQGQDNGTVGYENTEIENFRLISPGSADNFQVHGTLHYTVNANGEATAYVDNYSAECK